MEQKADLPPIELLLALDAEYREKAAAGRLKLIAPKKFNPEGKAWLPIMQTERDGWRCTILFSNTQRAHELGKTHDWVVIYFSRGGEEQKCTIVTEFKGDLSGKRVVRGREEECKDYYRRHPA
jgi:hypothetical protein